MMKNNWKQTLKRFDQWWDRKEGMVLLAADLRRPAPVYKDISEFTDIKTAHEKFMAYLENGAFTGDLVPDMSSYLGPGSLCTFIGAEPIYSDKTIWYKETGSFNELLSVCKRFAEGSFTNRWYEWSISATEYYKSCSENEYRTAMPDLQQNLDILAALMGADRLLMKMMDEPKEVMELMEMLYLVWEKAFDEHWKIISGNDGYSAYTHYNIIGKGKTSVLQSDISCMISTEMFDKFELPFLRRQCRKLDNVIYHLDGPGAVRHLDSILTIEKINAVQWVPGAGQPGNADECWNSIYDKITEKDKGLYVFLLPNEIDAFLEKYGRGRVLIRSLVDSCEEQSRLADKYIVNNYGG